jgi:hypothetical protein
MLAKLSVGPFTRRCKPHQGRGTRPAYCSDCARLTRAQKSIRIEVTGEAFANGDALVIGLVQRLFLRFVRSGTVRFRRLDVPFDVFAAPTALLPFHDSPRQGSALRLSETICKLDQVQRTLRSSGRKLIFYDKLLELFENGRTWPRAPNDSNRA